MFHSKPVHLARELVAELLEEILPKQFFLESVEHTRFDPVAPNGQEVVAAPLVAGAEAPEPVLARHDEPSTADAAFRDRVRQRMPLTVCSVAPAT